MESKLHSLSSFLQRTYSEYNKRELVHPDPLEFLYRFERPADLEIVGLVSSCLAYGRVSQILKSVEWVLGKLGNSPLDFVCNSSLSRISTVLKGFKHRFTTGEQLANMLWGAGKIVCDYGSLEKCFIDGMGKQDSSVIPAIGNFVKTMEEESRASMEFLLPLPDKGSACKRFNLYLRWMVRRDEVDPGPWSKISTSKLVVPLDTHMHAVALALGLTQRKSADLRTALEITKSFSLVDPQDPVRFDFSLTRFGIGNISVPDWAPDSLRSVDDNNLRSGAVQ